ncbi:MAG TPA: type IX secretion system membrane protein PorP/SprF [Flavobacteriales bacterium]|jgi:type IX secretion system PorP/SprF family membrane protein|nr:type IX secretion system membrane protein PorP/SprF [Flavobacteriales bacterium]HOZ39512.1 type IX secretion system membrane protein PorP/SprF [Flavobacteriales bacterium]
MRAVIHSGRVLALVVVFMLGRSSVHAQQDPLYSQYMFNTLAFNPAYAGSADVFTVMALSRHQWVGFEGAPATQTFLAHTPLRNQALALGLTAMTDKVGPARQTGAFLDLAYRIRTGADTRLSFGLKGGVNSFQADLAGLATVNPDQANVNVQGQLMPNFGFGLYWHAPRYYVGLSAPKLLENELVPASTGVITTSSEVRHFFLMGGYVLDLGRDLKFKPSFMTRVVKGSPLSVDLNASFLLRERIWFGALYRLGNAFGVFGQYRVNDQLSVGYAFDLTTTKLGAYNAGTHEVMLSYDLRFIKGRTISPRYF